MKPLRMRLQAFGPYANAVEIDFRDLSLGGLFLIHGPTGAGKTSILDGLCFSLFGKSSGSERSAEGLRCDLAKTDLPTEAQLEFSLGLHLYKVVRRPRQSIKSKRGESLTSAPPKGELFEQVEAATSLDGLVDPLTDAGQWRLIASGDRKTDERIIELLGMSEEQFRQVVVLPQGQFRKFLSSTSDDREELLETLFRTQKYRDLTEHLQARANRLASEISARRQALLAQLSAGNCESIEQLDEQVAALTLRDQQGGADDAALENRFREAQERRDRARAITRCLTDLRAFSIRESDLEAKRPEIDVIARRLEDDKRSRPVLAIDTTVLALDDALRELHGAKLSEEARLEAHLLEHEIRKATKLDIAKQLPEIEQAREERHRLTQIFTNANLLKRETQTRSLAEHELIAAEKRAAKEDAALAAARSHRTRLATEFELLVEKTAPLSVLRVSLQERETERTALAQEIKACEEAGLRLLDSNRHLAHAEQEWRAGSLALDRLKLSYHRSQAALLARQLKETEPCPVCGSVEHPLPALLSSETKVSPEAVEAAEGTVRLAADRVAACRARVEGAREEQTRAVKRLAVRLKVVDVLSAMALAQARALVLDDEISKLVLVIDELAAAVKVREALQAQVKTNAVEISEREFASKTAAEARETARSKTEAARARVAQLEASVPEDLRDVDAVTAKGQSLRAKIDAFEKYVEEADGRLNAATESLAASRARIETVAGQIAARSSQRLGSLDNRERALKRSGFPSLDECRGAALGPDEARGFEKAKKAFDDEWAVVSARLTELRAEAATAPDWATDLDTCEREFEEISEQRGQRMKDAATLKERLGALSAVGTKVRVLALEIERQDEHYRTIGKLGAVAAGQPPHNLSRVNFPRYVLAARLDEVLEQASRRLFLMSRGQFILRRSRSVEDKRRNAGLDLEVEDSFTGTARSTSSLSGGEGFLASLSLALGLADVVQSRLGGVKLDAVFVDEGFGTLDAEALELAIKTLSELQAGGRMVGIISHVPELKDQIARRLHVRKSGLGSQVSWDNALI